MTRPFIILPGDTLETAHRARALITARRMNDWVPDPRDKGYMCDGVLVGGTESGNRQDNNAESRSQPSLTISAGITLYRSRGDQLERYGFTAFGLTVIPYLVMSVVNFFAHFAVPRYNALYIVQSDILDEATVRLGHDIPRLCIVGKLPCEEPKRTTAETVTHDQEPNTDEVLKHDQVATQPASSQPEALPPKAEEGSMGEPDRSHGSEHGDDAKAPSQTETVAYIVSRFPSVQLTVKKRPLGSITIGILRFIITLSSFVIIAIISRLRLGTMTRPAWEGIFIVWLVFSSLSLVASTIVRRIPGNVFYFWVLKGVYNFLSGVFGGVVNRCLRLVGVVQAKKLAKDHKDSVNLGWKRAYKVVMFLSQFVFFVLILVMVSQQLIDYGDCTYFRP
ncbi:hypothetical protein OQA88_12742 [Cercophora sp. LCS_1]